MAARSAAGRGVRTACARIAGSTAVARSCTCTTTITITITDRVTVAVDVNGADLGPVEVARGAARAAAGGIRVLLFGPAAAIGEVADGVSVVDAPVSIAKDPDPARAVRRTPESSIVQAVAAVAAGDADALVSGGSTGAALAASLFTFKRARGVHRPALAIMVPVPGAPFLLLDAGANVEVRPEHLVQFAHMGAAFMEAVGGVASPRVALLSNGTEASKGTETVVAAHGVLSGSEGLNFVGNVEGFAIGTGAADVIVADGFTGNVALKVMEGSSSALLGAVRSAALSSRRSKLGGLLLRPALRGLRDELSPEEQGGAVLLGLRRLAVVPHGSFGARGFQRAIEVAARGVREDVAGRTHERLVAAGAQRRASEAAASVPEES
jgi:glycerol-3-phosphate acyltransferase PlsX